MHIIHVSSEFAKVAKVGGLGDVVYGLTQELARQKHNVTVILPKYDCIDYSHIKGLKPDKIKTLSQDCFGKYENTIWHGTVDGIPITLIEPHHKELWFHRGCIYGCEDDILRFTYFSRAVLDYLCQRNLQPDVLHVHDWPTALICTLYTHVFKSKDFSFCGTLLTIHNLHYQGKILKSLFSLPELKDAACLEDTQDPSLINILQGGILTADTVTTVSPNYAQEIQTPQGGSHLHEVLIQQSHKLHGILNGIDPHFWNPSHDAYLIAPYTTRGAKHKDISKILHAKARNLTHLRSLIGLQECERPLVVAITRLVLQKGPTLLLHALRFCVEQGGQFILLGDAPEPSLKPLFENIQKEYKDHPHARLLIDHDEPLAHLLFAAAHFLVLPSIFEPCGLTQMIALRYATLPIARLTGGIVDTVFDSDSSSVPLRGRNGFTFEFPDTIGVEWALGRALSCYATDREKYETLVLNAIEYDFSWNHPGKRYIELYEKLSHTSQ